MIAFGELQCIATSVVLINEKIALSDAIGDSARIQGHLLVKSVDLEVLREDLERLRRWLKGIDTDFW